MLLLHDLNAFAEAHVLERQNLEGKIVTAEHDEASKLYKDVVNDQDNCTLFVLIPSHDDGSQDEDNAKMQNNLTFIVMKKADTKASNQTKIQQMAICQLEILALAKKIKSLVANFGDNCIFRDIQLNSIQITPLSNYLGANGYTLSFSNTTPF